MDIHSFQPAPLGRLLCEILRLDQPPDSIEARMLPSKLTAEEWSALAAQAARHELAPLLFKRHKRLLEQLDIPPAVLESLHGAYLLQVSRSVRRAYWLGQILQEMAAQRIPVVVLKGAFLGEVVYGDPALRSMGDIDLLVRQEDLQSAVEVLRGQGYRSDREFWLEVELRGGHQLPSFQKSEAASVELHWRLNDLDSKHPIEIDQVWQRAVPLTISGASALSLCPEDCLLHLCLHAANHNLSYGLRAVYDVALTISHFSEAVDWSQFRKYVWQADAERLAYLLLWLASDLLRAPVPPAILSALRPENFGSQEADLAMQLIFDDPGGEVEVPHHLFKLMKARGIKSRIRLIFSQLFLPPNVMRQMYGVAPGSWKVLRCYPVRWWSLLNRSLRPLRAMLGMQPEARRQVEASVHRQRLQEQLTDWLEGKPAQRSG